MDTNKMRDISREQFEAWHRSVVEGEPPHEKYNSGDYRNQHVQRYWLGWQASREAVVVQLPVRKVYESHADTSSFKDGFNRCHTESRDLIEAQGLKVEVKP